MIWGCLVCAVAAIGMYALGPTAVSPQTGSSNAQHSGLATLESTAGERIAGIGFIEPETEIRRLVFPVDGVIEQCSVSVGDHVGRGQILMNVRNHKEQAALDLARREHDLAVADKKRVLAGVETNELQAARHQRDLAIEKLRHAKLERERYASLRKSSAASGQEFDQAVTALNQAETLVQADEARLRHLEQFVRPEDIAVAEARCAVAREKVSLAQKALDDTNMRAPCDGTVLEILKREGDGTRVMDGQPSIIFADLSRLRVRAEIDERHVHLLNSTMTAVVTGRALGFREYRGKVCRVNRLMGPKTVFARVADERRDLDVVQVLIDMGPDINLPVGLRVDVYLEPPSK
jgi:HlyD family secretion protein